jgi:hypothetical protein
MNQEQVTPIVMKGFVLRNTPEQGQLCEFCLSRSNKQVPAFAVVLGSPMCKTCYMGSPQTGTVKNYVDGKLYQGDSARSGRSNTKICAR